MSGIHCSGNTPNSKPKSSFSVSAWIAVPIVAALLAPATSIASSMYALTNLLLSPATPMANNKSGLLVKPIAAIRIFHAVNAEASSKLLAIVVALV